MCDTEIASLLAVPGILSAGVGVPHRRAVHFTHVVQCGRDGARLFADIPSEFRHGLLGQERVREGTNARHGLQNACGQRVLCVGDQHEALRVWHLVPPVVGVVRLLELIHRRVHHQFRHGQSVSVEERVHVFLQGGHVRGVKALGEVHVRVVHERIGPAPVGAVLVVLHLHEVDGVQHHGHNAHHALGVHRPHIPGGPPALAGARHDVVVELRVELGALLLRELRDRVHRAQRRLHHREAKEPLWLGRVFEEVVPGVRDDGVFTARFLDRIATEGQVLVGDLEECASNGARVACEGGRERDIFVLGVRSRAAHTSTSDPHGGVGGVLEVLGDHHHQVMPPNTTSLRVRGKVFVGQPSLRGHIQSVGSIVSSSDRRGPTVFFSHIDPAVILIRSPHIII
mmetsp:Transcript_18224/g.30562  ORF Transcript_18224/g.30562 Transcript_18224/m.30562 type:complete len:398 (-) Transcript_18224:126-1319(-)